MSIHHRSRLLDRRSIGVALAGALAGALLVLGIFAFMLGKDALTPERGANGVEGLALAEAEVGPSTPETPEVMMPPEAMLQTAAVPGDYAPMSEAPVQAQPTAPRPTAPAVSAPARPPAPTAPPAGGSALNACLSRNQPMPNPYAFVPTYYVDTYGERTAHANHIFSKGMLLSAGMYGNPPMDVAPAFAEVSRNPSKYSSPKAVGTGLMNLMDAFDNARHQPDAALGDNCGLVLLRRMLRARPQAGAELVHWVGYYAFDGGMSDELQRMLDGAAAEYVNTGRAAEYPEGVVRFVGRRIGYGN